MKKNKNLMQALKSRLDVEELHDPNLHSVVGGCGPMGGGGTNINCNPTLNRSVGEGIAEATCPLKPIFTGSVGRDF